MRTRQPVQVIPLAVGDLTRGASAWSAQNPSQLYGARTIQSSVERSYGGSPFGEAGVARKWSRVANAGIDFGTSQVITQNAGVTILVVASPTAGAIMKVPFSQRVASGSYTQTDFVFNAASIDSLGATAGQLALTTYHNASGGVLAAGQIDGRAHCWVAGNGPANGYIFRDGAKQTLSASTRTSTFAAANQKLRIGNMADDASTSYVCDDPVYQMIFFDRLLPEAQARMISENPQRAIAPRRRFTFFDLGGASSVSASAAGGGQSDGVATLAAQVAIEGVGVAVANGTGNTVASVPLSAAGITVSDGAGNGLATVTISASGLAVAAAQAGLSANVLRAGAAAAQAAGNALLAAQLAALADGASRSSGSASPVGGAPGTLSASGSNVADGAALLTVAIRMQASGLNQATGSASGIASAPGAIAAAGGNQATGWATVSTLVTLTAAGFVQAMGAGEFTASVPISADGQVNASGRASAALGGAVRNFHLTAAPVVRVSRASPGVRRLTNIQHKVGHV